MPTLTGAQARLLWQALLDAFSVEELRRLLRFALGERLDDITLKDSYADRVFDVIQWAERGGRVPWLIAAACDARPSDAALRAVAGQQGLSAMTPRLESVLHDAAPYIDVAIMRARIGELEAQVCRVEIPEGSPAGTGFLVGPDLVLTSHHVIGSLADGTVPSAQARLRFDYKVSGDGTVVHPGTVSGLAAAWRVASRPPSPVDEVPDPGGLLPAPDELDFALLRLREDLGDGPVGLASEVPGAARRGWIRLSQVSQDGIAATDTIFIVQHPAGQPLKVSFGPAGELNANKTRVRYKVSTERGSSGAPCLNSSFELVAVHHAGDPNWAPAYNAGVPISAIRDYLARNVPAAGAFPN